MTPTGRIRSPGGPTIVRLGSSGNLFPCKPQSEGVAVCSGNYSDTSLFVKAKPPSYIDTSGNPTRGTGRSSRVSTAGCTTWAPTARCTYTRGSATRPIRGSETACSWGSAPSSATTAPSRCSTSAYGVKIDRIAPVVIEDDVYVGRFAMLLGGTTIGAGSIVGAGAVVRQNIPSGSVVVGNPAKVVARVRRRDPLLGGRVHGVPLGRPDSRREGAYDAAMEPELRRIRQAHFFKDRCADGRPAG